MFRPASVVVRRQTLDLLNLFDDFSSYFACVIYMPIAKKHYLVWGLNRFGPAYGPLKFQARADIEISHDK